MLSRFLSAKFLLEVSLFLIGIFGPSIFKWIHAQMSAMRGNSFGVGMTVIVGLLLCWQMQKHR